MWFEYAHVIVRALQGLSAALKSFPSPSHTLTEGGHTDGEAADYVFGKVTAILHNVSGGIGLLPYLAAIQVRIRECRLSEILCSTHLIEFKRENSNA